MSALRSRSLWLAPFVALLGVALCASALTGYDTEPLLPRNLLIALAAGATLWMVLNADPVWLISIGIALGVFNGNWAELGFGSTFVPDRLLIGAGLAALLLRIPPQAKERPRIQTRTEYWLVAAAAVYVTISAIVVGSIETNVAFFRLLDRFGLLPFFMFAVAPVAFRTRHQRNILLGTLIVTGAYLGVTTWADAIKLDSLVWPDYIQDPNVGITIGRGRGPFAAADANGLALLATAVAALIGLFRWRTGWLRAVCLGVALLAIAGTFLTLTRSVWVGTAAAGIVTMLSFRELRPFFVPAVAAAAAAVLLSLAVIPGLADRAEDRANDDRPVWDRRNSTAAAVRMLGDRPLLGFGWNQYTEKNTDYFVMHEDIPLTGQRYPLHNVYLSNAVELGVIGGTIWLVAVLACLGGAIVRRGPPELRPWRIALTALVVQWIAVSALAPFPYSFPNLLLWTLGGIVLGGQAVSRPAFAPAHARAIPDPT